MNGLRKGEQLDGFYSTQGRHTGSPESPCFPSPNSASTTRSQFFFPLFSAFFTSVVGAAIEGATYDELATEGTGEERRVGHVRGEAFASTNSS